MSSQVPDHLALELQQFDIQFKHMSGKKNVVADAISRIRTLGLYQNNSNDDIATVDNNMVQNIVEEVNAIEWVPNLAGYNMEKLSLAILREEQWQDTFCFKKIKALRAKQVSSFTLGNNSVSSLARQDCLWSNH